MLDVSAIPILSYVNFYKKESPSVAFNGFLVSSSKNFLCIKEFYDYVFVGYCFIAYSEISEVELNNNHQKVNNIASREGWLLIEAELKFINQVSNWSQLVNKCFDDGIYLSCENKDGKLFIGRVISANSEGFTLMPIGADFFYTKRPMEIIYLEVKSIIIGSKYIEIYKKYSS